MGNCKELLWPHSAAYISLSERFVLARETSLSICCICSSPLGLLGKQPRTLIFCECFVVVCRWVVPILQAEWATDRPCLFGQFPLSFWVAEYRSSLSPLRQAPKNTFFPFSQQVSVIPPLLFACIFRLTQKKRVVSNKACCDYCSCCLLTFVGYLSPLLLFSNGDGGVKRVGATKWSFPFLGTGGPKHKGVLTIGERERSPHFFSAKDLFFFLPRQPTDPPFLWRFMGKKWSG